MACPTDLTFLSSRFLPDGASWAGVTSSLFSESGDLLGQTKSVRDAERDALVGSHVRALGRPVGDALSRPFDRSQLVAKLIP